MRSRSRLRRSDRLGKYFIVTFREPELAVQCSSGPQAAAIAVRNQGGRVFRAVLRMMAASVVDRSLADAEIAAMFLPGGRLSPGPGSWRCQGQTATCRNATCGWQNDWRCRFGRSAIPLRPLELAVVTGISRWRPVLLDRAAPRVRSQDRECAAQASRVNSRSARAEYPQGAAIGSKRLTTLPAFRGEIDVPRFGRA